ncbi:MAG: metallophosphoesterase [Bacteroidota bacterium]
MKRRISLLPLLVIAFLFIGLNWYVLSGLQTLTSSSILPYAFWSFIILAILLLVFGIRSFQKREMTTLFKFSAHLFLILFTTEVIFAVVLFLGDLYCLIMGIPRSYLWVDFDLVIIGLVVIAFVYGIIRGKYAYRVIKHTLYFDDLPPAFDGFTISQISDVHAGSFTNPNAVQRGIDLVKAQKSDLFVFTGDLVNNKADEIKPWLAHFSQIKAPYGQFSILGNHDYGDYVKWDNDLLKRGNLQQLKTYHADLGYRLLLDEHVELHKDGEKIILAGVENWGLGFGERGDLQKALTGTKPTDFKVLLSHDPTHWEAQVKKFPSKVQLTLAGHTHGMQFGIEAFGIKWSPVKYRYAHWAGVTGENGIYLNINRGFGFIGFSGRVGIWPEITVIELKRT